MLAQSSPYWRWSREMRTAMTLTLHVYEANLRIESSAGLGIVDAYAVVFLERDRMGTKQKTSAVRKSLRPRWDNTFIFGGLEQSETVRLEVKSYRSIGENVLLAHQQFSVQDIVELSALHGSDQGFALVLEGSRPGITGEVYLRFALDPPVLRDVRLRLEGGAAAAAAAAAGLVVASEDGSAVEYSSSSVAPFAEDSGAEDDRSAGPGSATADSLGPAGSVGDEDAEGAPVAQPLSPAQSPGSAGSTSTPSTARASRRQSRAGSDVSPRIQVHSRRLSLTGNRDQPSPAPLPPPPPAPTTLPPLLDHQWQPAYINVHDQHCCVMLDSGYFPVM